MKREKPSDHSITPAQVTEVRPRSLVHALSEIEQFSVSEQSSEIPYGALTTFNALSFFEVGVKTGLITGMITALMTPLMMSSVLKKTIPVFGSYEYTAFDKAFSVALTVSFSLCYAIFIFAVLVRTYTGNITKRAINSLVGGLSIGAFFKSILVFFLFHMAYYRLFTVDNIALVLFKIRELNLFHSINYMKVFYWLVNFREVFIPSAYFNLAISIVFMVIVIASVVIGRRKSKMIDDFKRGWE